MMSAIENLGKQLNSTPLDNKIHDINLKNKKGKESYLCTLDFSSNKGIIDIKSILIDEANKDKIARDYLWIGNLNGNKPQWHVTTDNLIYSLNCLYELYRKASNATLKDKLLDIIKLYYNIENKIYLKDIEISIDSESYPLNFNFTDEEKQKKQKDFNELIIKKFKDNTNEINGYYPDIVLYTVCIDGQPLAQDENYKIMLIDSFNITDEGGFHDSTCSICGNQTQVTDDTREFQLKYYNTDKVSFSPDLESINFKKNFAICSNCYNNLLKGESYALKHLKTSIGNTSVLIIPESIPFSNSSLDTENDIEHIFNISNSIITENNEIMRIEKEVTDKKSHIINLMFYEKQNNYFKIIDFVPEIQETRIIKIGKNMFKTSCKFRKAFFDFSNLNILNMYQTLLIKNSKEKKGNTKNVLRILINLFKLKPIDKNQIIKIYLNKIRNDYYNKNNVQTWNIIRMYAYLEFLESIKLIGFNETNKIIGENEMEDEKIDNKIIGENEMENKEMESGLGFIENISLTEDGKSLLYMGYAIRYVGMVLFKNNIKSNPMLEKINFQGMNFKEVEKLMNQIDEKIKQYGIFSKDVSYAMYKAHSILAKYSFDRLKWPLDDVTNVFLIMTGYSIENEFIMEKNKDYENGGE